MVRRFQKEINAFKTLDYRAKIQISKSLFERLQRDISKKFNVNVSVEPTGSRAKGYYNFEENKIVIDPAYSTSEKISTLFHELGHHQIHGKQFKEGILNYDNLHKDRGAREGEAESFSYILSSMAGIENKSELYIKTWGNDGKDLKERFELITGSAKETIETLDLENIIKNEHIKNVKNLIQESQEMQGSKISVDDLKLANQVQSQIQSKDAGRERD